MTHTPEKVGERETDQPNKFMTKQEFKEFRNATSTA